MLLKLIILIVFSIAVITTVTENKQAARFITPFKHEISEDNLVHFVENNSDNEKSLSKNGVADVEKSSINSIEEETRNSDSNYEEVTYIAAVLEYTAYGLWDPVEEGNKVLIVNSQNFVDYAEQAKKQGADIMVTPEYGVQSFNMNPYNESTFLSFTQYVPNPSSEKTPCYLPSNAESVDALRILSCGAIDNEIYLVIDMAELSPCSLQYNRTSPFYIEVSETCPTVGYFIYNTQVVFDRHGTVIARYRKQNLFLETGFTPGPTDDSTALFLTDFKVAFSLQICFDIVFDHPGYYNARYGAIKDIIMSTAWIDELPFDTANGIQNSWSRGLEINLIVGGHHKPEINMLGSGIFKGYSGNLPDYVYDRESGDVLLVSSVKTIKANVLKAPPSAASKSFPSNKLSERIGTQRQDDSQSKQLTFQISPIIHEDLTNYTKIILQPSISSSREEKICSQSICCSLSYTYVGNLTYMFMIYDGRKPLGDGTYFIGMQICGVVWCENENFSTCAVVEDGVPNQDDFFGPFQISSFNFVADLMEPFGIHRDLSLIDNIDLKFSKTDQLNYILSTDKALSQPLSIALYGRLFSNDL